MNQKHCRGCPHLDFNEMSDEMYCKLMDFELIRLRWHKQRPDWCPLVTVGQKDEKKTVAASRTVQRGQDDCI